MNYGRCWFVYGPGAEQYKGKYTYCWELGELVDRHADPALLHPEFGRYVHSYEERGNE